MATKNFDEWVPFLNDVLTYWDQNGLPDKTKIMVGGVDMSRADIVAMRDNFAGYDERVKAAERALEALQDARGADALRVKQLGVDFLAAMKGRFGASSQQARNCPVVSKRRTGDSRASNAPTSPAA